MRESEERVREREDVKIKKYWREVKRVKCTEKGRDKNVREIARERL